MKKIIRLLINKLNVSLLLCIICQHATSTPQSDFILGTHYYGLKEYSWPINYLNSLTKKDVEKDLTKIKSLGFNTIVLLASWGEFEPQIGVSNEFAYNSINSIITQAKSKQLKVYIRIPYLWSLATDDIVERTAYALLNINEYREKLFKFIQRFENRVIKKHDNIIGKFGSWEDFYVLRDLYFSTNNKETAAIVRETFSQETGIEINTVKKNGSKYNIFLRWIDEKIDLVNRGIKDYGYEIRADSDLYTEGEKRKWHSHRNFFENRSGDQLITYWAPYFGQNNMGESLDAKSALKSFNWMLDLIMLETPSTPFVDQLNFFDNSPGTEKNAYIKKSEYENFFNGLTKTLLKRTHGYSFWTIKDYSHNIVYNSAFKHGAEGWKVEGAFEAEESYITLMPGSSASQELKSPGLAILDSKDPKLVVNIISGKGTIEISPYGSHNINGPGRHEFIYDVLAPDRPTLKITNNENNTNNLKVEWIALFGHSQYGRIMTKNGGESNFFELVKKFNFTLQEKMLDRCYRFEQGPEKNLFLTNGVFNDGWTNQRFSICYMGKDRLKGLKINYHNPFSKPRFVEVNFDGSHTQRFDLEVGLGSIYFCPPRGIHTEEISVSCSSPFVPSEELNSRDKRKLGINLTNIEYSVCDSSHPKYIP